MDVPVLFCVHDDHWFLREAIRSFKKAGPITVCVSKVGWDGSAGNWAKCQEIARAEGAEVVVGDWVDETSHRRHAQQVLRKRGVKHCLIPDGDEIIEPKLLVVLKQIGRQGMAERVHVHMDTFWKSTEYIIRPRERLTPAIMIDLEKVQHDYIREYHGGRILILEPGYGVLSHLSYAGPEERIKRKISTWSHKDDIQRSWFSNIYLAWDEDRRLHNLHPTHPAAFGFAERIEPPKFLKDVEISIPAPICPEPPQYWPSVSIIIPLYGGENDISLCLASLQKSKDLISEIIVVDDCSPDEAAEVAAGFSEVTLLRNEQNHGFAKTCNVGYRASTGEVVIFLNSDTVVPRSGLIRLIESLCSSPQIGMVGPHTNNCGYQQPTEVTYTTTEGVHLFAQDFAARDVADLEVSMLVGFCLAAKRFVLEEVMESGMVFDERFGQGLFEDNDLCYRVARAGYRLKVATRSFVHHTASQSLARLEINSQVLLAQNMQVIHAKWNHELQSGFASHLPGMDPKSIVFDQEKRPNEIKKRIRKLAQRARLSLTMIVKNEEKVLADCLSSVDGVFWQTVIVDTGSSDRTIEIAKSFGVEVVESSWKDSFSAARNEALDRATCDWVFWLDADDVLPPQSAETILNAVLNAPPHVTAFVVPVQFIGEDQTRVDHVKLFRRLPGVRWEHRIHEQILPSLSSLGTIARLDAVVMHANYDNTPEGQRKEKTRLATSIP